MNVPEKIPDGKRPSVDNTLDSFNFQAFHSLALAADTALYEHKINFQPDHWLVVARCSVGNINIHNGGGRATYYVRLDLGTAVVPWHGDTLTVETVGASGFFDVYAVHNLDEFDIKA